MKPGWNTADLWKTAGNKTWNAPFNSAWINGHYHNYYTLSIHSIEIKTIFFMYTTKQVYDVQKIESDLKLEQWTNLNHFIKHENISFVFPLIVVVVIIILLL